ncbi:TetR/AcrR family transcriptional regulator [Mycolicibacterium mengxianglii]|uniref:TetR/AcrR family transcriptional regulator n=1 Tax=Mycolicibacterium mengxianglii TaxID=2736649 RepID=UPI0018EED9C3|nr:TetR/AcrR family transcriptional regulator [Mycolicibacterium mengxianglii]
MVKKAPAAKRPGRRSGQSDTRAQILDAARTRFTQVGYRAATMRAIATDVGVDPALISYFFGSKEQLFGAAFELRANPAMVISGQIAGPLAALPERLLTALVHTWDDPANRSTLLTIAQTGDDAGGFALTRGFVEEALEKPILDRLLAEGVPAGDARRASAMLATTLVGVIYARYVLAIDAAAEVPGDAFIAGYLPVVRAALSGCVPSAHPSPTADPSE